MAPRFMPSSLFTISWIASRVQSLSQAADTGRAPAHHRGRLLDQQAALAPVEQIRKEAEAIYPADLTTRLRVPHTDDELARLAQTLNAMLARIEAVFVRSNDSQPMLCMNYARRWR